MRSKYKLFCFDMDGTLLDSMGYWRLCNVEFLLRHKLPFDQELLSDAMFRSSRVMSERYIRHYGLDMSQEEIYREYELLMLSHYEREIEAKPGAMRFLLRLREEGIRACVGTATPRLIAERALTKTGLMPMIEFVTDPFELGADKSKPLFFENLAKKAGVAVSEICMVEDAYYAMKGAKAAGCGVYAIEDAQAFREAEEIKKLCDVYVKDYFELL